MITEPVHLLQVTIRHFIMLSHKSLENIKVTSFLEKLSHYSTREGQVYHS